MLLSRLRIPVLTLVPLLLLGLSARAQYSLSLTDAGKPYGWVGPGDTAMGGPIPPPESPGLEQPGMGQPGLAEPDLAAEPDLSAENFYSETADRLASAPQSLTPNMIGDTFGGGTSQSAVVLGRMYAEVQDIAAILPFPGPDPFEEFQDGDILVLDANGAVLRSVTGLEYFRTSVSSTAVLALVSANPNRTKLPIVDIAPYRGLVNYEAVDAFGPGGTTTFVPGGSYAQIQQQLPQLSYPSEYVGYQVDIDARYAYDYIVYVHVPNPGGSGVVGRTKIAENTSPLPRDRLLFDYNYFNGVPLYPGGVDVHRFTPGFEKTFCDGWSSFELRLPMAVTLDSTIMPDGETNVASSEFGNVNLTIKQLLARTGRCAFSAGLTVTVPTAADVRVVLSDGTELIEIRNESVHLKPFLGALWTPNDRCYAQGFLQYDIDTNGSPVSINADGNGLSGAGRINDAALQYLDLGLGYWVRRGSGSYDHVPNVAVTGELHWNKSVRDTDVLTQDNFRVGDFGSDIDRWNLTLGAHLSFPSNWTASFAYVTPLGGAEREFDGEFRLLLNRFFGASARAPFTTP